MAMATNVLDDKKCKGIVQQGPRIGLQCQKERPDSGYCTYHQRNKEFDELTQAGKHLCNGFFRGCKNELTTDELQKQLKYCSSCRVKKSGKQYSCNHSGCKSKIINEEDKYCKKHTRDHYRDYEKEANIQYCDIERGCFNVLTNDIKCSSCRDKERLKTKHELTELRNKYNISLSERKERDELFESQECIAIEIKEVWRNIQRNAMLRKLLFTLTQTEFENLVIRPCYYCGFYSDQKFVGIDRIDNNKGYILNNCIPCCKMCNMMKNTNHPLAFLEKIDTICSYKVKKTPIHTKSSIKWTSYFSQSQPYSYNEYKNNSENVRNIRFLLTKTDYEQLLKGECYLCGICPMEGHRNGIDRIENDGDYTLENCKPCCGHCNKIKRDYSYTRFLQKCIQIHSYACDKSIFELVETEDTKLKNEYYTAEEIAKFLKDGYLSRFLEWCEEKKKSVEFTSAIICIASKLEPTIVEQIIKELENERRRKSTNLPLEHKKHIQASTVYAWLISGKDDEFLEWYTSTFEKTSLFDIRFKELKETLSLMSKEDGIKACKKFMYDEKSRRNSQKIRDEKKRDIQTYVTVPTNSHVTPDRETKTDIDTEIDSKIPTNKLVLIRPTMEPIHPPVLKKDIAQVSNRNIPKQWKVSDIYKYILEKKENIYLDYIKIHNEIDTFPEFEQRWANLLSDVKTTKNDLSIREFVTWLWTIRHTKLCSSINAQRSLTKKDRQHYRTDAILILFNTKNKDDIQKYKSYTEAYTNDDPNDPKWDKRWSAFVNDIENESTDEGKRKIITRFVTAQRKKKYDRTKGSS